MGANKRYAAHYDRLMDARILEQAIARADGPLQSLDPAELDLEHEPVTRTPKPSTARVWVRFGSEAFLIPSAELVAWTNYAYAIRFDVRGTEYKTWVWSSAVEAATKRAR